MNTPISRWLSRRSDAAAPTTEPEIEHLRVLDAIVQRRGDHYWIVRGGESPEELSRRPGSEAAPRKR